MWIAGIVGNDDKGTRIQSLLAEIGAHADDVFEDPMRPTTTKLRVMAHAQQIVRIDRETKQRMSDELQQRFIEAITSRIEAVDGRRMFGLAWLETFYDACTAEGAAGMDCRIDHQAVHAYSCDSVTWMVDLMKAKAGLAPSPEAHCTNGIQDEDEFGEDCGGNFCVACSAEARAHFAKPVWLTEFAPEAGSCGTDDPDALAARSLAFAERELAALDADPYVFRYAWFMPKTDIPSLDHVDLLDASTPGAQTALGDVYLGQPCPTKRRKRRRSAK